MVHRTCVKTFPFHPRPVNSPALVAAGAEHLCWRPLFFLRFSTGGGRPC